MDGSPVPVDTQSSPIGEAPVSPTPLERLETLYPNVYSLLMRQDSQKPLMRALEELETKETNARLVVEAEKELEAANDAVYAALAAVDKARKTRDDARQRERDTIYRFLPF